MAAHAYLNKEIYEKCPVRKFFNLGVFVFKFSQFLLLRECKMASVFSKTAILAFISQILQKKILYC